MAGYVSALTTMMLSPQHMELILAYLTMSNHLIWQPTCSSSTSHRKTTGRNHITTMIKALVLVHWR